MRMSTPAKGGRQGGAAPPEAAAGHRRKVTRTVLQQMKRQQRRIVMVTAYDFPFARLADQAGADILLVGDTLGMVVLGFDSTLPVTMEHMVHHTQAVARSKPRAMVVGDLPFMSYQVSPEDALRNAGRLLKEAGAEAVKLEGGEKVVPMVEAIARADIPVMGHLGLTPQSVHQLGGYRVQGREADAAQRLQRDARLLQESGCFALVLEAIPDSLASLIQADLSIPVIGIGAGASCDGQVLVLHDMLGLYGEFVPRFVKRYADLAGITVAALESYIHDVRNGRFPGPEHSYGG
jgi:3-methyl-2-oxobutanoate hydroxymethyltransferase